MAGGNADDLRKEADVLDVIASEMSKLYADASGGKLSEKEARRLMDEETWLTAEDAMALGLVHAVEGKAKAMAAIDKNRHAYRNIPKGLTMEENTPAPKAGLLDTILAKLGGGTEALAAKDSEIATLRAEAAEASAALVGAAAKIVEAKAEAEAARAEATAAQAALEAMKAEHVAALEALIDTCGQTFYEHQRYRAQVQLADAHEAAAIDPKAEGLDLTPMLELLCENEDVLKVFHAGGQDIEIFFNLTGKTPHPMFDTQIAAMALGQGEQVGYSNLVDLWMGIQLDKGARFTDWSRRPLDKRQIDYAIADVTHLSVIFPMMLEKLKSTGRGAWLNDEMERISDAANYRNDPENAWARIKVQSRKPEVLGRLQAMAAWREKEAQRKNIPRGRIMKDETLADIAAHPPKSQADLPKVRGLSPAWRDNDIGARLIGVIEASQPMARENLPDRARSSPGGGKDGSLVADLLKLLLKIRSREINVAPRLIVRTEELERLAAGEREDLEVLTGWRFDQFGRDALDLVEGRLAFAVVNGKLKMTLTHEEDMVRETPA
jgi:ribonuclease D